MFDHQQITISSTCLAGFYVGNGIVGADIGSLHDEPAGLYVTLGNSHPIGLYDTSHAIFNFIRLSIKNINLFLF